ncbi:MAG: hypothetical protein M3Q07_01320 [Pseudobdellovibrionaceae bacterium]|nr:hypothetical protein [Pseudobdellovibrionaceae bacterium]
MKKVSLSLFVSAAAFHASTSFACVKWKSVCTRVEDGVCMEWTSICESGKGEGGGSQEPGTPPKPSDGGSNRSLMRSVSPVTFPFVFNQVTKGAREIEISFDEDGTQRIDVLK